MRLSIHIPSPDLVSNTFPDGHKFPYTDATEIESAVWYWAVLRFKKRQLDWYFEESSFNIAVGKMTQVFQLLGNWNKVVQYIQWFLDQDANFAETARWEFNYLVSGHSINKYLGNEILPEDVSWWRDYIKNVDARKAINSADKLKAVEDSRAIEWAEIAIDYAAKLGVDPDAIKKPFEK